MPKRARSSSLAALKPFDELKYWDHAHTMASVASAAGIASNITDVAQDNTATTRVGQKMLIKSMGVEMAFQPVSATVASEAVAARAQICLCAIVVDRSNNETAVPTFSAVYNLTANTWHYKRNLDVTKRYRVLMYKVVILSPTQILGSGASSIPIFPSASISYYKKFKEGLLVEYKAGTSTGAAATIERNLCAVLFHNQAANASSALAVNYGMSARIRFLD